MKRILIPLAISLLSLALFTSCTSSADTLPQTSPGTSQSPGGTSTNAPAGTMNPSTSTMPSGMDNGSGNGEGNGMTDVAGIPGMTGTSGMSGTTDTMSNGGVNTVEDAKRVSDQIEDEVEKLSEVDEAEVVVAGNIAIVAIEYDDQYQGGLTDRLKDMITERVETIDKAVTSVHVTDSRDMKTMVKELSDKLESAGLTFDELQTQLLNLGSSIAGGGTPEVSQPQSNTGA